MKNKRFGFTAAVVAALLAAGPALADTIDIVADVDNASNGVGLFEGSVDYTYDGLVGHLAITLTNTNDPQEAGWITAIAFDLGGDVALNAYGTDTGLVNELEVAHAPPFSTFGGPYFDYGVAIGEAWLNTGLTSTGIGTGETGTFNWTVTGEDASALSAIDFFDAGKKTFGFVVRFRGLDSVGHDKVPARAAAVVPVPAPVALGAVGLIGAALGSRRMRRQNKSI